jgi:CcmD family protein
MSPSEKYTAAAYLVVFVAVLAYVVIIASKLQRLQREVARLVEVVKEKQTSRRVESSSTEVRAFTTAEHEGG